MYKLASRRCQYDCTFEMFQSAVIALLIVVGSQLAVCSQFSEFVPQLMPSGFGACANSEPNMSITVRWQSQCYHECQHDRNSSTCVGLNYRSKNNTCDIYNQCPTYYNSSIPGCQYFQKMKKHNQKACQKSTACDVNCSPSGCAEQGQGRCDSKCARLYGLVANHTCKPCNTPHCNDSCNNFGLGTCDGLCLVGYGNDPTTHTCKACTDPQCRGSCNNFGLDKCDGPCAIGYVVHPITHNCTLFRYETVGCYRDGSTRDLPYYAIHNNGVTLSICAHTCFNLGYQYAGTQYSTQCFCGNTYGSYGTAPSCNSPCSGNSTQMCGGGSTNTVLIYRCDPNCADAGDCIVQGVGKCDNQCVSGWNMTSSFTCTNQTLTK